MLPATAEAPTRSRPSVLRVVPFAVLALAGAWLVTPALFDLDDAYIVLHSAQVLASHHPDPIFGTPALTGITSPAYLALVLLFVEAHVPPLVALRIASVLGTAALAGAVWLAGAGLSIQRRVVLLAVALGSGVVLQQSANGLETGWAMALTIALLVSADRREWRATAILAALTPWLRPDLAPIAAAAFVYAVWPYSWRTVCAAILSAVAVGLPFAVWLRVDTGHWLPQTMNAKTFFFASGCHPAREKTLLMGAILCAWAWQAAPLALGLIGNLRDRLGRLGLLVLAAVLTTYWLTFPAGLHHNEFRYTYALLVPLSVWGLRRWLQTAAPGTLTGIVALLGSLLYLSPWPTRVPPTMAPELQASAEWIDAHAEPGATILIHDAGAMSVFAHHSLVDLVGLKTPSSIAAHQRDTWPSCGAGRGVADAAIARDSGASYLMVVSDWEPAFHVADGITAQGIRLSLLRPAPAPRGYAIYRIDR